MLRKASDVVVALDLGSDAADAGFDDVRVDCTLGQEIHFAESLALLFEDADEFFADEFSLGLGV